MNVFPTWIVVRRPVTGEPAYEFYNWIYMKSEEQVIKLLGKYSANDSDKWVYEAFIVTNPLNSYILRNKGLITA